MSVTEAFLPFAGMFLAAAATWLSTRDCVRIATATIALAMLVLAVDHVPNIADIFVGLMLALLVFVLITAAYLTAVKYLARCNTKEV